MNYRQLADALFPRPTIKPAFTVGKAGNSGLEVGGDLYSNQLNATGANIAAGADVVCVEIDGQQVVVGSNAFHTP